VAIELAQIVAGFPFAASFAIAGGLTALREGRRRTSLNEAVHELRRPLQVLALSLPADSTATGGVDSSLRLVAAAVDRLEREINGGVTLDTSTRLALRPAVEAAVERWQVRARRADRALGLRWLADDLLLHANEAELDQVLDNVISNAFEHGSGGVSVEVREDAGFLRVAVLDCGCAGAHSRQEDRGRFWARISGRARHGHGLRIVRRMAARHGGSFKLRRSSESTEARLELPLTAGTR
jgi:signal transduction histidine kinase